MHSSVTERADSIHFYAIFGDTCRDRLRRNQSLCLPTQATFNRPVQDARQFLESMLPSTPCPALPL